MDVVIGGASGIGASVVTLLGASTLTADRVGGTHFCDLQDATTLVALAATVTRLDALVITAGVSPSMADARVILDIDLTGMARVLDAFDHLIGEGTVVVCIASMAGHLGTFPAETLTALDDPLSPLALELTDDPALASMLAKHGVMRMVRRMAVEYGRRGARIVSVSPGVIATPMGHIELASGNGSMEIAGRSALGRTGTPEEVAPVIVFLCSKAASFVTGVDLLVDGGAVASLLS